MTTKYQNERRLFYLKDIIVYLVAALVIFGLFLGFVILPKSASSFSGFNVLVDNNIVLTYDSAGDIHIDENYAQNIEYSIDNQVVKITIHSTTHHGGYNVIEINTSEKTAKVVESNCSNSKDCVFSPSISISGAIYCAPHALKVTAIGGGDFIPPSVG